MDPREEDIWYEGKRPPGLLEGKITPDEFYTPEQIRHIISETFPQQGKDLFSGLKYIKVTLYDWNSTIKNRPYANESWMDDDELIRKIKGRKRSREDILEDRIPSWDDVDEDMRIEILEEQIYRKKDAENPPAFFESFERNTCSLVLTDLGYALSGFGTMSSNKPD